MRRAFYKAALLGLIAFAVQGALQSGPVSCPECGARGAYPYITDSAAWDWECLKCGAIFTQAPASGVLKAVEEVK